MMNTDKLIENLITIYRKEGYSMFDAAKLAECTITLMELGDLRKSTALSGILALLKSNENT